MILLLAGTSDALALGVQIQQSGYDLLASVVTESASRSLAEAGIPVRTGRLTQDEMVRLIQDRQIRAVVDASHPFAAEAHKNAMGAARSSGVPYIRYERPALVYGDHPRLRVVATYAEAAAVARQQKGVILLTTGSKTLEIFAAELLGDPEITLIARMLPRADNMGKCEELGIAQRNIIAMQGPFLREMNAAIYRHYGVTLMITKESGKVGAVDEKVETALQMGIDVILIARPTIDYGEVFSGTAEVLRALAPLLSH